MRSKQPIATVDTENSQTTPPALDDALIPRTDPVALHPVVQATGLAVADGVSIEILTTGLEQVAQQYFWDRYGRQGSYESSLIEEVSFSAIADAPVTPSRVRDRLIQIAAAAKRVYAGRSRRPQVEKVAVLLERLGYHPDGKPRRYSGKEKSGHGGSERSAVRACLMLAIRRQRSASGAWKSRAHDRSGNAELRAAIQALANFAGDPTQDRRASDLAARAIHDWTQSILPLARGWVAIGQHRHDGDHALDACVLGLVEVFAATFGCQPSSYDPSSAGPYLNLNPWDRFLQASLGSILAPDECPSPEALRSRLRRLMA